MSDHLTIAALFLKADPLVKTIISALLVASFWTWIIIFEKFIRFAIVNYLSAKFEKKFWSGITLETFYSDIKNRAKHPLARIFIAIMKEWQDSDIHANKTRIHLVKDGIRDRLFSVASLSTSKVISRMRNNLAFLASAGSVTPFVGLFGTVWGIMVSFQSIAVSKNTSLAVVAPGIAEALLATGVGLMVAIPSVVFYNFLNLKINRFRESFEDFYISLINILSRELDKTDVATANNHSNYNNNSIPSRDV